jgi:hypothetical protein
MCGGDNWVDPGSWVESASDALADIDPGPAIGSGLADVDKFVNNEVPGGWKLPAALAIAYATGYVDPELFASELGTELTSEAAQDAFFEAVANGATSEEALQAGLALENVAEAGSYVTPELMGPSYGELGVTGVEGGLAGPTYGELGYSGITGAADVAAADAASYAAANNITLADAYKALSTANQVKNLATSGYNLLTGKGVPKIGYGSSSGLNVLGSNTGSTLTGDTSGANTNTGANLKGDLTKGNTNFSLNDFGGTSSAPQLFNAGTNPAANTPIQSTPTKSFSTGGGVEDHNPTFFSPGGLASMENTYVKGEGDGTSDSVAAMLANGEFVIPADVVSKLGNGSNDAGAGVLDEFLSTIREHAQKHDPKKLPPDSKGPLAYLAEANKKTRA